MKNIKPIQSWKDGNLVDADLINIYTDYDNLKNTASFCYELWGNDVMVSNGKIVMSGDDYQTWGSSSDINLSAYQWVVNLLNLELV